MRGTSAHRQVPRRLLVAPCDRHGASRRLTLERQVHVKEIEELTACATMNQIECAHTAARMHTYGEEMRGEGAKHTSRYTAAVCTQVWWPYETSQP